MNRRLFFERVDDFCHLLIAVMFAMGAWKPEYAPLDLPQSGTSLLWMRGLMLVVAVTSVWVVISGIRYRALMRQYIAGTLELDSRRPPQFATYLLWFLPTKIREPLLGDLEEQFHEATEQFGVRRAKILYWSHVILSFWSVLSPVFYGVFKKIVGWGFFTWAWKIIRQFLE